MGHLTLRQKIIAFVVVIMATFLVARGVAGASRSYDVYLQFVLEDAKSTAQTLAVAIAQDDGYLGQPARIQDLLLALKNQTGQSIGAGLVGRGVREIMVADRNGDVVAATTPGLVHVPLAPEAGRALSTVIDQGTTQTFQVTGGAGVGDWVAVPIEADGQRRGTVLVQYFQQPARILARVNMFGEVFTIAVVTMGLILILLVGIRKMVVQPLAVLKEGAACLSHGNLDTRVELKTGDELEIVARTFNQMAESLKDYHAQQIVREKQATLVETARNTAGELSQPLTVALGYAELLYEQEDSDPEFLDEALPSIRRSVLQMTSIVRHLSSMDSSYAIQVRSDTAGH